MKKLLITLIAAQILLNIGYSIYNSGSQPAPSSEKIKPAAVAQKSTTPKKKEENPVTIKPPVIKADIKIDDYNFSDRVGTDAFYLTGTTSSNCSKIVVKALNLDASIDDVYELESYKYGDTTFKYGIREDWNNLGPGNNQYLFTASCDNSQEVYDYTSFKQTLIPQETFMKPEVPTPQINTNTVSPPQDNCHTSYIGQCLNPSASDYDCRGGSGNGPYYTGTVQVVGPDVFGLDRDKDGWGCE